MLLVTRELLTRRLLELPSLADAYAQGDSQFVGNVFAWLVSLEQDLGRLRSPLTAFAASERAMLQVTADGYREPGPAPQRISPRRAVRIAASLSLTHLEPALRQVVSDIDIRFLAMQDKVAQLLAVASTVQPIPVQGDTPREVWLQGIWSNLQLTAETVTMHRYISAALSMTDLLYVLGETLDNLLRQSKPSVAQADGAPLK